MCMCVCVCVGARVFVWNSVRMTASYGRRTSYCTWGGKRGGKNEVACAPKKGGKSQTMAASLSS